MTGKLAVRRSGAAMSRHLARTLERAERYAAERGHGALTLEHLLLSFTEDPDTLRSFKACGVSLDRLREEISQFLSDLPADAETGVTPAHSAELSRLMDDATDATLEANRSEINSFIVLAALVGNEQSGAARLLERHGFTWEKAIQALQSPAAARAVPEPKPLRVEEPPLAPGIAGPEEAAATTTPWPEAEEPELPAPSPPGEIELEAEAEAEAKADEAFLVPPHAVARPLTREGGEPRFAAEPRSKSTPAPQSSKSPDKTTATPDDIMASVRQKLGTKPPTAKRARPSLDLPLAPKWQSIGTKPAAAADPEPVAVEARTPDPLQLPPMPASRPDPEPTLPPAGLRQPLPVQRSPRAPFNAGLRPTTLEALAAEAARAARGRAEAAEPPWSAPSSPAPPLSENRGLSHSRRLVDLAGERNRPLDDALVEAPPHQDAAPARPQPRHVEISLAALMGGWPRSLRVGRLGEVSVELRRADLDALVTRAAASGEDAMGAAGAVTLRLKAEGGAISIEPQSPETQWVESASGIVDDGMVGWRWTLSPQSKGRDTLRLVASIRTLGADGSTRDSGLDDGRLQVRVRGRGKSLFGWIGWTLVAILGGLELYEGYTGTDPLLELISSARTMLFGG